MTVARTRLKKRHTVVQQGKAKLCAFHPFFRPNIQYASDSHNPHCLSMKVSVGDNLFKLNHDKFECCARLMISEWLVTSNMMRSTHT